MTPNDIPDSAWTAVLSGQLNPHFEFLACKLLLTNLRQRLRSNSMTMAAASTELRAFFVRYGKLPAAQNDLNKISAR